MIRARKAESNVIAELLTVGIAVILSIGVFFAMASDDTAGDFGALAGTLETPSERLLIGDLVQKCPEQSASVMVKNTGGLDANIRTIAINDATNSANIDAKYPSSATSFSLQSGATSDPVTNTQCNDTEYMSISSTFYGIETDAVDNTSFDNGISGWSSSYSSANVVTSIKYYLTMTLTTGVGTDYREMKSTADSPDSSTIISFGNKKNKHFLFKPGYDNGSHDPQEHNGTPKGYGWRTTDAFDTTVASGTWKFGFALKAINLDDADGYVECEIYSANPDGSQAVRLFLLNPDNIDVLNEENEGTTIPYSFSYDLGSPITLTGKILLYECYLHVTNNNSSNSADLNVTIDSNAYIEIPLASTITIDSMVHDPATGNLSPGSAKGVINDNSDLLGIENIDYYFESQFTSPAQFSSMTASYAWSYTEAGTATNTKLNFVRLMITDWDGNIVTTLHCDDNASGTCAGDAGWTSSTTFNYIQGITSIYALSPSTNYRLVVHFQVSDTTATDTATLTLSLDDVDLTFVNGQYKVDALFSGLSNESKPSNIKLFVDSTVTTAGPTVIIQAFDYTINDYSTTSAGMLGFTFATQNSDHMVTKDLSPTKFFSNGQWKFKITATYASEFTMKIDLVQINAIISQSVLRERTNIDNVVIEPGQTLQVDASLSRPLDSNTAYKITITTERNSYSELFLNDYDDDLYVGNGIGGLRKDSPGAGSITIVGSGSGGEGDDYDDDD